MVSTVMEAATGMLHCQAWQKLLCCLDRRVAFEILITNRQSQARSVLQCTNTFSRGEQNGIKAFILEFIQKLSTKTGVVGNLFVVFLVELLEQLAVVPLPYLVGRERVASSLEENNDDIRFLFQPKII